MKMLIPVNRNGAPLAVRVVPFRFTKPETGPGGGGVGPGPDPDPDPGEDEGLAEVPLPN